MVRTSRPLSAVVIGVGLVLLGVLALAAGAVGADRWVEAANAWALFVVAPGVILFAAAFVPEPPRGLGFAMAGAIVTITGLVLWTQQATDRYDTWAYAWALVGPGGAGFGLVSYALLTGTSRLLRPGLILSAIAVVLFAAGAWYFEPVLTEGRQPVDLEAFWPVLIVAIGAVTIVSGLLRSRPTADA
jgi:hypothetical protein